MSLEKIVEVYADSFEVVKTEGGEEMYEWADNQLNAFSTMKLADILTLSDLFEGMFQDAFIDAIEEELVKRSDFVELLDCRIH